MAGEAHGPPIGDVEEVSAVCDLDDMVRDQANLSAFCAAFETGEVISALDGLGPFLVSLRVIVPGVGPALTGQGAQS